MRLNAKDSLYGLPILKVRDVLRKVAPDDGGGGLTWEYAAENLSKQDSKKLLKGLLDDGYIIANRSGLEHGSYRWVNRTEKGSRLAMGSARALRRATAERYVAELLTRIRKINADDRYCYHVKAVVVFGSYMNASKEVLGDLDVAALQEDRWDDRALFFEGKGKFFTAHQASIRRALDARKNFSTYVDQITWPEREIRLALKKGMPGLSLHDLHGDLYAVLNGPHRVIYGKISKELRATYEKEQQRRAAVG